MSKRKQNRQITFEPLEDRRMFVTYQVTGTSGADAISISIDEANNKIISAVNGVSDSASDLINNNIQIDGLGGNDTISITETGSNTVVVNAGTGNDTINVGNGANNMDSIQTSVTINGDGNTDAVIIWDQSNQNSGQSASMTLSSGNEYHRVNAGTVTANVENVTLKLSITQNADAVIDDPPTATVLLDGSAIRTNRVIVDGANLNSVSYAPDGAVSSTGAVTFGGSTINYVDFDALHCINLPTATLVTPNANDSVTVSGGGVNTSLVGSSGGVAFASMTVAATTSLVLDLAAHDGGAGNDHVTGASGHTTIGSVQIKAGTGTNSFAANGGTWNVSTVSSINGTLDVTVDTANVTFSGAQSLHRLQIDNGGTVNLGTGAHSVPQLAVVTGNATLDIASGGTLTVPAGTGAGFGIGAGRTLVREGVGTLVVTAPQTHGAGAILENRNGNTSLNTDAGSVTSRTLTLKNTSGATSLNATQHLSNVIADGGIISMSPNGSRVLVTNSAFTGLEGGAINLNNNDMVLDYSAAADATAALALLHSGYSNGSWDGLGINSATAASNPTGNTTLGTLFATEFKDLFGATATFDGQTIDNTALLVKYTYYGDVDFNGAVDSTDYNLIDFGFVSGASGWANGDVDGNGSVDSTDYNLIDFAFVSQGAAL